MSDPCDSCDLDPCKCHEKDEIVANLNSLIEELELAAQMLEDNLFDDASEQLRNQDGIIKGLVKDMYDEGLDNG